MQKISEASLIYYVRRQCAEQWRVFLTVLAEELADQLDEAGRPEFMRALGHRMANKLPHREVATLRELEIEINQLWEQMEWGYVVMREEADCITLIHCCAPLRAAFGGAAVKWTPALLEGVYGQWFKAFGAGDDLVLRQTSAARGSDDAIEFRLARSDVLESVS